MKIRRKQFGLSLTEILTSLVIIVLLGAMSMPAINAFLNSMGSTGSCESMINASLASARAIAMREQRYAGVRFQKVFIPGNGTVLKAPQFMIFIIQDTQSTGLKWGFRAMQDIKPIELPENIGVMDMILVTGHKPKEDPLESTQDIELTDTTTFSIIFSPQGNLVVHGVWVRNGDGKTVGYTPPSADKAFNTLGTAMFCQDDYFEGQPYDNLGLGPEPSRRQFIIYEQDKFKQARENGTPYSGYLLSLATKPVYLNSYSGQIISTGTK